MGPQQAGNETGQDAGEEQRHTNHEEPSHRTTFGRGHIVSA